jgi:hypothetical protein
MENLLADILKITQLLFIPALILFAKSIKKQTETSRDIRDLKTYTKLICREMKIPCTLKDV